MLQTILVVEGGPLQELGARGIDHYPNATEVPGLVGGVGLAIEDEFGLLATGWGLLYLVEIVGFVLLPSILFGVAYREHNLILTRIAAVLAVLGVVLNRFNITFVVFNWDVSTEPRYVPNWMEIWVTVAFITFAVVAFRLIASHLPILYEHPDWSGEH